MNQRPLLSASVKSQIQICCLALDWQLTRVVADCCNFEAVWQKVFDLLDEIRNRTSDPVLGQHCDTAQKLIGWCRQSHDNYLSQGGRHISINSNKGRVQKKKKKVGIFLLGFRTPPSKSVKKYFFIWYMMSKKHLLFLYKEFFFIFLNLSLFFYGPIP